MKKKILLALVLIAVLTCLFAIGVSAETPSMYIEFGARFPDSDEYITVYTENAESTSNPRINFKDKKFYSDIDFTQEVDMSTVTGIDFSVTKTYVNGVQGKAPTRMVRATDPFVNCEEVKWFLEGFPTISYDSSFTFNDWTGLKYFDFGNATAIGDNVFQNTGFETLTIPATITKIYGSSFKGCLNLTSVTFEGGINSAGNGSIFNGCTSLETVNLGKAVSIGGSTFSGCTALTTVTMSNESTLTSISNYAFSGCTSLVPFAIPGSVTSIGNYAFSGCTSLAPLAIPGTITSIGNNAFENCTAFTSLTIPNSVTSIGSKAFYKCTGLKTVTFPETVSPMALNGNTFSECTALESINIPEGITKLGNFELYKTAVKTIHIPSTVTSIGYQFAEESAVETLTFAENSQLTFIDHRAFRDCDSLVGPVILPYGLEEMDYGVFENCALLKAVKMPDSLTTLSGNASLFNSCSSLEYVQFSKNLTGTIYKSMFENCKALKAISFPNGITKIDYKALRNCTSLEAVYLPSGLQELGSVSTSASDWGVFYQSPKVYLVNEPFDVFDGDELVENFVTPAKPEVYYMPSGMTALGNSAFQDCTNLNRYIVFPTGITSVGECSQGAFFKASSSTNPVTFVFLGDMTSIRIRQNDNASSNMSFLFANPNDTGITSMSFIIGSANNGYQTNSYAYFCASNTVYDLTTFKATNGTTYTVTEEDYTKTVNTAETQPHFADPKKTVSTDATCETNKSETTYCFCNALIGTAEVENSALGHNHDLENGATLITITYADFTKNGYKEIKCSRCENVNTEVAVLPVIIFDGYSVDQATKSIFAIGFRIDKDAIDAYEEATGNTLTFGIIGVLTDNLSEKDENGNVVNTFKPLDAPNTVPVIKATVPETVTAFNLKIRGFNTDEYRALDITMSALVTVTDSESNENTVYIQSEQVESPSAYSVAQYIADNA